MLACLSAAFSLPPLVWLINKLIKPLSGSTGFIKEASNIVPIPGIDSAGESQLTDFNSWIFVFDGNRLRYLRLRISWVY